MSMLHCPKTRVAKNIVSGYGDMSGGNQFIPKTICDLVLSLFVAAIAVLRAKDQLHDVLVHYTATASILLPLI